MQDAEQEVEWTEIVHRDLSDCHDCIICSEHMHQRIRKRQKQRSCDNRVYKAHRNGHPERFFHTVIVPGAVILSYERGCSHTKARHWKNIKSIDLHIGTKARHRCRTERIDARLHEHVGK